MKTKKKQHLSVPKVVSYIGKILQFFSVKLTTLYLARLFTTPIKHKVPIRELGMDSTAWNYFEVSRKDFHETMARPIWVEWKT